MVRSRDCGTVKDHHGQYHHEKSVSHPSQTDTIPSSLRLSSRVFAVFCRVFWSCLGGSEIDSGQPRFIRTFLPVTTACCFQFSLSHVASRKTPSHSREYSRDTHTDTGSGCRLSVCSPLRLCLHLPESSGCLPAQYGSFGLEYHEPAGLRWSKI